MTQEMTKEKNSNHKPSAHYALCHHTYMYTCLELPTLNTPLFPPNYKHSNTKLHALVWNEHDFIFGVGTAGLKLSTSWTCAYNILTFRQIKGVTMATSCHVASPWHTELSWRMSELIWAKGSPWTKMQVNGGKPKPKGKATNVQRYSKKTRRAELPSSTSQYMPKGIIHWPTADLPVHHDGWWNFCKHLTSEYWDLQHTKKSFKVID